MMGVTCKEGHTYPSVVPVPGVTPNVGVHNVSALDFCALFCFCLFLFFCFFFNMLLYFIMLSTVCKGFASVSYFHVPVTSFDSDISELSYCI